MNNANHEGQGRQTLPGHLPSHLSGQSTSADDGPGNNGRRVLDAEVLGPDEGAGRRYSHSRQGMGGGHNFGHTSGHTSGQSYGQSFGQNSGQNAGQFFGQVWTMNGQRACSGPAVGFFLFLLCLVQFGLLAAIGFAVFLGIGSLVTGMVQLRLMMQGRDPMPWFWRVGNWLACYGLTAWLAGGRG